MYLVGFPQMQQSCSLSEIITSAFISILSSLNNSLGGLKFGVDSNGNYGYIKAGADTVTPFSNGEIYFPTMRLGITGGETLYIVLDVQGCSQITIDNVSINATSNNNATVLSECFSIHYNTLSNVTFTEVANFNWKSNSGNTWNGLSYDLPNDVYQIKLIFGGYFRPYNITDLTIK